MGYTSMGGKAPFTDSNTCLFQEALLSRTQLPLPSPIWVAGDLLGQWLFPPIEIVGRSVPVPETGLSWRLQHGGELPPAPGCSQVGQGKARVELQGFRV